MTSRTLLATVGATALALCAMTDTAARQREVVVPVVFTEAGGTTPATGMTATRIVARIDGVAVPAARLAPSAARAIVILVDVTSSVSEAMASFVWDGQGRLDDVNPSGTKPPDSPSALLLSPLLRGVLRHLDPADRVRVGRIARTTELGPPFTTGQRDLERAFRWALHVPEEVRHAEAPIWDAVDMAVAALEPETGQRAVILVTDGLSTGNRYSLDAVIERAQRADVAVFVIGEAWRIRSGRGWSLRDSTRAPWFVMKGAFDHSPESHMRRLAHATGGVFIPDGADGWPNPEARLRTAVALLHASYTLTMAPPVAAPGPGILTIDVAGGDLDAHVKERLLPSGTRSVW